MSRLYTVIRRNGTTVQSSIRDDQANEVEFALRRYKENGGIRDYSFVRTHEVAYN